MNETPTQKNWLAAARKLWKKADREMIAAHHGVSPEHPAFSVLLAFCVRYGLDPLGGHVWLVDNDFDRVEAKDGESVSGEKELDVAVTRDGFLSIALRDPSYEGMEFDAVRTKDEFQVIRREGEVDVYHVYPALSGKDDPDGDGDPADAYRGDLLGSYCLVYVKGRRPTYYFAWLKEHGQYREEDGRRIFEGAWKTNESAMSIKSAQSVALRLALGLTGVVGIDEVPKTRVVDSAPSPAPSSISSSEFVRSLDLPDRLWVPLAEGIEKANEEEPNSWSLAKVRMTFGSPDKEHLEDAAERALEELGLSPLSEASGGEGEPEDEGSSSSASVPAETVS